MIATILQELRDAFRKHREWCYTDKKMLLANILNGVTQIKMLSANTLNGVTQIQDEFKDCCQKTLIISSMQFLLGSSRWGRNAWRRKLQINQASK